MGSSTLDASLLARVEEGVLTLTLNRPAKRNAIDPQLRDALAGAIEKAATDPSVRGVVLTGSGGAFCAGGDLARFDELHDARVYRHGGEDLDAQRARDVGLLSELATADDVLLELAHARVERMLARAPLSFGAAKRLLQLAADADQRSAIVAESLAQTALLQSEDHREALAAARERRDPEFRGG